LPNVLRGWIFYYCPKVSLFCKEIFEKAVKDYPKFAPLYDDLAKVYVISHDYEKALDAYHKVIELAPDSAMAREAEKATQKIKRY